MNRVRALAILVLVLGAACHAQTTVIQGDALKTYVVGQKGRTITLDRGSRLTFFADGTFIDCNSPKLGHEGCDTGTYSLEADKVMRTYDTWLTKQESPLMLPIVFKKEGPDAFFNAAKIIGRTEEPTLLLATREQILGLAGKTFKEYYRDEGLIERSFDSSLNVQYCVASGCVRSSKMEIVGSRLAGFFTKDGGYYGKPAYRSFSPTTKFSKARALPGA